MKRVYAVLEVSGQGRTEPVWARGTGTLSLYEPSLSGGTIETFNSEAEAVDRARELVRQHPTRVFHVVVSTEAFYSSTPVTMHRF